MSDILKKIAARIEAEAAAKAAATKSPGKLVPLVPGAAREKVEGLLEAVMATVAAMKDTEEQELARVAVQSFMAVFLSGEQKYPTVFRNQFASVYAEAVGCSKETVYSRDKATKEESGIVPELLVPREVLQLTWAGRNTATIGLHGSVTGKVSTTPVTDEAMGLAAKLMEKYGPKK